ncbi:MAG: hypothetical protein ACE5E1_04905 [Phycisphaerae bacterium]
MSNPLTLRFIRRKCFWRAFWVVVFLMHLPATVEVFSAALAGETSHGTWTLLVQLVLSDLFFILEIIFASSLRLLTNGRRVLVFFLVLVLLHVAVLGMVHSDTIQDSNLWSWLVLTIFGTACALVLRLAPASRAGARAREMTEAMRRRSRRAYARAFEFLSLRGRPVCIWRASPLRAPPC